MDIKRQLQNLVKAMGKVIHEPEVTTKHGKLRKSRHEAIDSYDDLALLEDLSEEGIVTHLFQRYMKGQIYTYIGDILLAVNPFTPLSIYSDEYSKLYSNCGKPDHPPHIFAIADQSFQMMMHHKHNQCIVISGESGAGKTESANFLVQQLTLLGRAPNRTLEDRILQVNPLIEAFGNAKTVINDNSSRFGKYLEMTFTPYGKVTGAKMSEYLLEKSRVIHQNQKEENFHIFYYIYDGLAHDDKDGKYHLDVKKDFRYMNSYNKDIIDVSSVSINRVKFRAVQHCFEMIGFKSQEVESVYKILSSILHIGNINFKEREMKYEQSCSVANPELLKIVASMLGINSKELNESLTTMGMVARGETIIRNNKVEEAVDARDSMAKVLYGRLFSWIVNKINALLKPKKATDSPTDSQVIGILDIFGFENFSTNSFEQLCINIANEQIQYYFNQHIFAWEMQEYKNEGIEATDVEFIDNRPVLDMFLTKPVGLLALLDEESHFPKATDQSLIDKFSNNIRSPYYTPAKGDGSLSFKVEHYAGRVEYDAVKFLEKNRDRLPPEIVNLLRMSEISLVRTLFQNPLTKTGALAWGSTSTPSSTINSPNSSTGSTFSIRSAHGSKGGSANASQTRSQQTVATYFRYSLMDLLSKMVAGTPHFVRCIRPNVENAAGLYDTDKVLLQLRYTGVLETTKIRRMGYSHRVPISEFLKRYYVLAFNWLEKVVVSKDSCRTLLTRIGLKDWAIGKTKVFLKYYHIEELSRKFEEHQQKIVLAQSVMRMWLQKQRFKKLVAKRQHSAVILQSFLRGYVARKIYMRSTKKRKVAATVIQTCIRGYLTRQKYQPVIEKRHKSAVIIQANLRGYFQRKSYKKAQHSKLYKIVRLQALIRGFLVRARMQAMKQRRLTRVDQAATTIQKHVRRWSQQNSYKALKSYQSQKETQLIYFSQQTPEPTAFAQEAEDSHSPLIQNETGETLTEEVLVTNGEAHTGLSDERVKQIQRLGDKKVPWTKEDDAYYSKIQEETRPAKKIRMSRKNDTSGWDKPLKMAQDQVLAAQFVRIVDVAPGMTVHPTIQTNPHVERQLSYSTSIPDTPPVEEPLSPGLKYEIITPPRVQSPPPKITSAIPTVIDPSLEISDLRESSKNGDAIDDPPSKRMLPEKLHFSFPPPPPSSPPPLIAPFSQRALKSPPLTRKPNASINEELQSVFKNRKHSQSFSPTSTQAPPLNGNANFNGDDLTPPPPLLSAKPIPPPPPAYSNYQSFVAPQGFIKNSKPSAQPNSFLLNRNSVDSNTISPPVMNGQPQMMNAESIASAIHSRQIVSQPPPPPPLNEISPSNRKKVQFQSGEADIINGGSIISQGSDSNEIEEDLPAAKDEIIEETRESSKKGTMQQIIMQGIKSRKLTPDPNSNIQSDDSSRSNKPNRFISDDDYKKEEEDESRVLFDFRSVLKKTNYNPNKTLRKLPEPEREVPQVDFRDVLKKRTLNGEENRLKKHVTAE
ncbi:unnamed protein product [Owenia fusiformis]|uniref:non-specific serine/threonine protein kinase n=1 Tax=Owenia fusiformis TaxID=6347 RepID=A0A8J1TS16_OWEFU|nr:unnamed protein product [Owenia fusiformis]